MSSTINDLSKATKKAGKRLNRSTQRVHKSAAKNIGRYSKKFQKDAKVLRKSAGQTYGNLNHNQKLSIVGVVLVTVSLVSALGGYLSAKKDQRTQDQDD